MSISIDTHVNAEEDVESCVLGSMEQLCRGVEKPRLHCTVVSCVLLRVCENSCLVAAAHH